MYRSTKRIAGAVLLSALISGCGGLDMKTGVASSPYEHPSRKGQGTADISFTTLFFDGLPNGQISPEMEGEMVTIDVSFQGVAPPLRGSNYHASEFITYLIGKPVPKYFGKSPMRGRSGRIFAVIPNRLASSVVSLGLDENFTVFGEVVYIGQPPTGEVGIRTIRIRKTR